jgi:hypothetical protein
MLMNRARDELLADSRFTRDQNREIRGSDELDLLADALDGSAGADDLVPALPLRGVSLQDVRDLLVATRRNLECLDDSPCAKSRTSEGPEHSQESLVDLVERPRLERVGGEHADDSVSLHERTAQTRVHVTRGIRVDEQQTVVGIGQRAVRRETNRGLARNDDVQAGVFATRKTPAEHFRCQAMSGERDEVVSSQFQHRGGIARDGAPNCLEKAGKTIL